MLDSETKSKIDSARDILVGKVPDPKSQVEQITIALIYKFMDDMDRQSEELGGKVTFFSGEFKKYAWNHLLDKRIGGHERLLLYAEGLDKMNENKNIPQLFRDIFKGAFLPYRDPETLNLFLKEIDGFSYDHSEKLGDAFEYLLSVMDSQGDAGQFRTPRHIIDFIVAVVDPKKKETILDPACGTAGFLISSYKHILKQNTKERPGDQLTSDERGRLMTNFCGYDISPDMVRLSRVNSYLHGFANPKIYEYDTLTSEERWDDRYDVIMANPPFMSPKGGIRPHNRFAVQAKRSEVLFVDYIAEHLNPGGRAGIIVPEGIIFQSQNAYKTLRKMLVENYLWTVVSLPAGCFNPYSGVKTSILFLDRNLAKRTDEILFAKVENDGFDLGAQRRPIEKNDLPEAAKLIVDFRSRILDLKKKESSGPRSITANAIKKSRILENGDANLSGDRYRETNIRTIGKWPMVKLGEITERITKGTTPTTVGFSFQDEGVTFVKIESILESGEWLPDKFAHISQACHEALKRSQLKANDVLFSIAGTFGRVAVVTENMLPANTNQALSIITVRSSLIPQFLFWCLKSPGVLHVIEQLKVGVAQYNVSLAQVSELEIPLPPLEIQRQIVAELEAEQALVEANRKLIEIFEKKIQDKLAEIWGESEK